MTRRGGGGGGVGGGGGGGGGREGGRGQAGKKCDFLHTFSRDVHLKKQISLRQKKLFLLFSYIYKHIYDHFFYGAVNTAVKSLATFGNFQCCH